MKRPIARGDKVSFVGPKDGTRMTGTIYDTDGHWVTVRFYKDPEDLDHPSFVDLPIEEVRHEEA